MSLSPSSLSNINAYWRACNYLAASMIYLQDNPLLKQPLKPEHIKNRWFKSWLKFHLCPYEPFD